MMRGDHTYFLFYLPEKKITILVNNLEGEATFVFYHVENKHDAINILDLQKDEYEDKTKNSCPFRKINWAGEKESWQDAIFDAIYTYPTFASSDPEPAVPQAEKQKDNRYTIELAKRQKQLEESYAKWLKLPKDGREKFSPKWLIANGYRGLYLWARKREELNNLVSHASPDLQRDFVYTSKPRYTTESALAKLHEAFEIWKAQAENKRGLFNPKWLEKKGYIGPYIWAQKNGGIASLLRHASPELQSSFEKKDENYTTENAIAKFLEAFELWNRQPKDTRGSFNTVWLIKSGYSGLYAWIMRNHPSIESFISQTSFKVQDTFEKVKREKHYTNESALAKFLEAFELWNKQPEDTRGTFNTVWLRKNGFTGLYFWAWKNNAWSNLVSQTPLNLQHFFDIPKKKKI